MTSMQNFYWYLICFLKWLFCRLPHGAAVRLGARLGGVMWLVSKKKVDGAERRCVRALQIGITPARRIVRESYRNIGRAVAETLRLPVTARHIERYVSAEGMENVRSALDRGRGVILLLGHLDNWEAANIYVSRFFPLNVIGADQRDSRITRLLMHIRSLGGARNIQKGNGLKGAVRCLRNGEVLCILHDQDARDKGLIVPFLGQPASTPAGVAKLAAKFGAAVVPTHIMRCDDGLTHKVIFEPALSDPSGRPFGEDEELCLRLCNDCIGRWILEHPEQWLIWLYPRWASTVAGDQ